MSPAFLRNPPKRCPGLSQELMPVESEIIAHFWISGPMAPSQEDIIGRVKNMLAVTLKASFTYYNVRVVHFMLERQAGSLDAE